MANVGPKTADNYLTAAKYLSFAAVGVAALTPAHASAAVDISHRIRIAGDLRTFTQRMALSVAFVMLDVDRGHFLEVLNKEYNEFNADIEALRTGDPKYNMKAEENKLVLEAINTVEFGWKVLGPLLKDVIDAGAVDDAHFTKIEKTNTQVMTLTDNLIHRIMKEYKADIPLGLGYQIDVAGSQQMLSQKMIKEAVLIALEFEAEAHHEMLLGSMQLFEFGFDKLGGKMAHNEVLLPEPGGEIAKQLGHAADFWGKAKPILQKLDETHHADHADLIELAKESDILMEDFGAITDLLIRSLEAV